MIAFAAGSHVHADRALLTPRAAALKTADVRYELAWHPGKAQGDYQWLQVGTPQVELQILRERSRGGTTAYGFGAQVEVVSEFSFLPSVSIGFRDVTARTKQGRAAFAVVGKSMTPPGPLRRVADSVSVNVGLGLGRIRGPFANVEIGTKWKAKLLLEHDSRKLNYGLEIPVSKNAALRAELLRGRTFYGFTLFNISPGMVLTGIEGL